MIAMLPTSRKEFEEGLVRFSIPPAVLRDVQLEMLASARLKADPNYVADAAGFWLRIWPGRSERHACEVSLQFPH